MNRREFVQALGAAFVASSVAGQMAGGDYKVTWQSTDFDFGRRYALAAQLEYGGNTYRHAVTMQKEPPPELVDSARNLLEQWVDQKLNELMYG